MPDGAAPHIASQQEGERLILRFSGDWLMMDDARHTEKNHEDDVAQLFQEELSQQLRVDLTGVGQWDTSLVARVYRLILQVEEAGGAWECVGAPEGVENLLRMALRRKPAREQNTVPAMHVLSWLGEQVLEWREKTARVLHFIGELTLSLGRLLRHKAYFRRVDFVETLADVGPRALPIVTLISFLVGLILAFVGAMQLRQFGAQIFVANLVGIAMAREMGAMMTGIIMAGRTGAAYAARLGTMQVNEEVDALRTSGIEPMDFLTLPRVLALVLMVPLLSVYAMAIGILGGMAIGVGMLDLSVAEYWQQTVQAVPLNHFWSGLIKSVVFAFVIGIAGCYHGLRSGRSSESVGKVTTVAVVSAIVFIILTDSLLTVVYDVLDF